MKKLFYRYQEDIFVDYKALSDLADEFGMNKMDLKEVVNYRNPRRIFNHNQNLVHIN